MDRGVTELIAKDVRTRSELEYLRGAGSRDKNDPGDTVLFVSMYGYSPTALIVICNPPPS